MTNESLLEHALPEGRKKLIENHENLKKVANYCEQNYLGAHNKAAALNETKKYTTHSLASVAYQVNTLASDMLMLLKEQEDELLRLTSSIENLSDTVDIHCEKVSRREVGSLTYRRNISRMEPIKYPANPERAVKYIRKAINYNELDDIGHGLRTGQPAGIRQAKNASIRNSVGSSGSTGTLTRPAHKSHEQISQYGTIRPVAAPKIPLGVSGISQIQADDQSSRQRTASANSSRYGIPMSDSSAGRGMNKSYEQAVPLPDYSNQVSDQAYDLPPPPDELRFNMDSISQSNSSITNGDDLPAPPANILLETPAADLPPPSFEDEIMQAVSQPPLEPGWKRKTPNDADWAPAQYQVKVSALYDYEAEREDELTFYEGQEIYVIATNADNWWEGVLEGRVGLFPGNYVQ
ncbi:unnamed protein product [Oikopleura dioica]|uniref:SH3 domain-containing protein n=1 Tax=Oikopleura dioica TaxID=34765 RepID=E4WXT0_OIKDI|nr:unnamed protein product [Oikopleura dioica]